MAIVTFAGLRGTGDWPTDYRPKEWDEALLYIEPNGDTPLTAMLSMVGEETATDPEYNWWTEMMSSQGGAVIGIYTDSGLTTPVGDASAKGDTVYVKMAEDLSKEFRAGHLILLRYLSDYTVDVVGKVTASTQNGASSYLTVVLREADDNSTNGLSDVDYCVCIGNSNAEGGAIPSPVTYDPAKNYNYTQIFRSPLEITRTARATKLRVNPGGYEKQKWDAQKYHALEREKAYIWGIATEETGSNGKPERTTMGLINMIKGGGTGHGQTAGTVANYAVDNSGTTWSSGGKSWLDTKMAEIFGYGSTEKVALAGYGAMLGIQQIVEANSTYNISVNEASYGIKVVTLESVFGTLHVKTHPLFRYDAVSKNSMVIFEPSGITKKVIQKTTFLDQKSLTDPGTNRYDSTKEEFLSEEGLKYKGTVGWGYLTGVGVDG